jgi:hypothetical protein
MTERELIEAIGKLGREGLERGDELLESGLGGRGIYRAVLAAVVYYAEEKTDGER